MFEVFAISTVRSSSDRPVRGSSSASNSSRTSASSLPRSPQPTYTITAASHHLAICCSSTVLPVPNPPGIAAVLPRAIGNSRSRTRWPVTRLSVAGSRARAGRGRRTGQRCERPSTVPPTRAIGSSTRYAPAGAIHSTRPPPWGGTNTRCSTAAVSRTLPKIAPGPSSRPALTSGVNCHARSPPTLPVAPPGSIRTTRCCQRTQHAVEHTAEQSGPELPSQRATGRDDVVARPEPAGVLVHLHGCRRRRRARSPRPGGAAGRPRPDRASRGRRRRSPRRPGR